MTTEYDSNIERSKTTIFTDNNSVHRGQNMYTLLKPLVIIEQSKSGYKVGQYYKKIWTKSVGSIIDREDRNTTDIYTIRPVEQEQIQ